MNLTEALALADHASPMPHLAGEALKVLRDELATRTESTLRADAEIDVRLRERDAARARLDHCLKILTGIHALLYPRPVEHEGAMFVFNASDANAWMQRLSDRIRAIPSEIDATPSAPESGGPTDVRILWGVVANAGRLAAERKVRWSHVSDATALGSQSSADLCHRFGFDPDEERGGFLGDSDSANG